MSLSLQLHRSSFAQSLARKILRLLGWNIYATLPHTSRYVLIGAPHTSNWDFGLMLLLMAAERIPIRFMGKDTLFKGPLGPLMRALGGFPVNRRESTNLVDQIAEKFEEYDDLIVGLAPEGTRSKTNKWRTGFYYIALKANVPVVMAYLDYGNRVIRIGPSFKPSGDIQADFEIVREFFAGVKGKNPKKQGEIKID